MMWVVQSDEGGDGRTKMGMNPDRVAPARTATAGPCPRRHGWPLPVPPWLAPVRAATAAFFLHAASPALYFRVLHPHTAPHGVDTISRPFLGANGWVGPNQGTVFFFFF